MDKEQVCKFLASRREHAISRWGQMLSLDLYSRYINWNNTSKKRVESWWRWRLGFYRRCAWSFSFSLFFHPFSLCTSPTSLCLGSALNLSLGFFLESVVPHLGSALLFLFYGMFRGGPWWVVFSGWRRFMGSVLGWCWFFHIFLWVSGFICVPSLHLFRTKPVGLWFCLCSFPAPVWDQATRVPPPPQRTSTNQCFIKKWEFSMFISWSLVELCGVVGCVCFLVPWGWWVFLSTSFVDSATFGGVRDLRSWPHLVLSSWACIMPPVPPTLGFWDSFTFCAVELTCTFWGSGRHPFLSDLFRFFHSPCST